MAKEKVKNIQRTLIELARRDVDLNISASSLAEAHSQFMRQLHKTQSDVWAACKGVALVDAVWKFETYYPGHDGGIMIGVTAYKEETMEDYLKRKEQAEQKAVSDRKRTIDRLNKQAKKLGLELVQSGAKEESKSRKTRK